MKEDELKEIEARINNGEETEEDIEILTDYFEAFMEDLK